MSIVRQIIERAGPEVPIGSGAHHLWDYDTYLGQYERLRKALGTYRELAWGTMIYACTGPKPSMEAMGAAAPAAAPRAGCGWEHRVWLCLGVEGPPPFMEVSLYIPSPFYCGGCPKCKGLLAHDRWNEDEEFTEPRELPSDTAYFVCPGKQTAMRLASQGYGGAEYIDPTGKTR